MLRKHHLFMHPLPIIYPTIHHPQVHVFMNSSIHHPRICVSTHPFIHPSIIQIPIHSTIHPSIFPSIYPFFIHPSIHPAPRCSFIQSSIHMPSMNPSSIHPNIDLPNYVFIHYPSSVTSSYGGQCDVLPRSPCSEGLVASTASSAGVKEPLEVISFEDYLSYRQLPCRRSRPLPGQLTAND